jgi:hypothetical protein
VPALTRICKLRRRDHDCLDIFEASRSGPRYNDRSREPKKAGGSAVDSAYGRISTFIDDLKKRNPPDHTITIARDACGTLEFDRSDEMIRLGYETAARSLGKP